MDVSLVTIFITFKQRVFNFGLRRTWTETLTLPLIAYFNKINAPDKSNFRYAFTDLNAKITHKFNDRNVLSANFYTGNDVFKFLNDSEIVYNYDPQGNKETRREISDISLAWGNTAGSLNWEYEINDKLSLSNKLYYSTLVKFCKGTSLFNL